MTESLPAGMMLGTEDVIGAAVDGRLECHVIEGTGIKQGWV